MKYSLFLIGILSYSTAHADAAIFKCTIGGVVTFQEEPYKELLNGEEETMRRHILSSTPVKTTYPSRKT